MRSAESVLFHWIHWTTVLVTLSQESWMCNGIGYIQCARTLLLSDWSQDVWQGWSRARE